MINEELLIPGIACAVSVIAAAGGLWQFYRERNRPGKRDLAPAVSIPPSEVEATVANAADARVLGLYNVLSQWKRHSLLNVESASDAFVIEKLLISHPSSDSMPLAALKRKLEPFSPAEENAYFVAMANFWTVRANPILGNLTQPPAIRMNQLFDLKN